MDDGSERRWLPVDTIIGAEASAATDLALAPLAKQAQRIRRTTAVGVAGMLTAGSVLAIAASAGVGGWLSAVGAVLCISVLLGLTAQWLGLVAGDSRWWRLYAAVPMEANLPIKAQQLLEDVKNGRVSVRYHRGQSGRPSNLSWRLARGQFGPLILASDPGIQALMMRDWYGGDGLTLEFQAEASAQTQRFTSAPREISGREVLRKPRQFNHILYYDSVTFDRILRGAYPGYFDSPDGEIIEHKIKVTVRSLQYAHQLLLKREFDSLVEFRDAIVNRLRADPDESLAHYGRRESSDAVSSSWLDKALHPDGYNDIQKRLLKAEARVVLAMQGPNDEVG